MAYAAAVRGGGGTILVPTMPAVPIAPIALGKTFAEILREHAKLTCPCCNTYGCEFVLVSEPSSPFELVSSDAESAASGEGACCADSVPELTDPVAHPDDSSAELARPRELADGADASNAVEEEDEEEEEDDDVLDHESEMLELRAEAMEGALYNLKRGGACTRSTRWAR